ncbi:MAG: hypothetical protein EU544_05985 [Promethearchaeota archaeon]|nr:MAG: hypothetical protein EU544_05985 [Candidatus Lokiarchaeota archaeon]
MTEKSLQVEYYPSLAREKMNNSLQKVKENKDKWDKPFFTDTDSYIDMEEIRTVAGAFKSDGLKNLIVLGTGGSIQTLLALKHLSKKNIYPITSSRSVELVECLAQTKPENSLVIPISRGGETLDVNSTIGTFVNKGYKFLGLSSQGTMNELLKKIHCPILDVPDLSGRFAASISNVAIVPSYLADIDIGEFLKGLEEGYKEYLNYEISPSLKFASYLYFLYNSGYRVVFSMPYSKNLEGAVGLFVQEISESTGKEGKGLMGAYQEAPLCQHSVLEYLLGGKKGAVIPIVWTIEKDRPDMVLESSIDFISGHTAQSIVNYQSDATFQALIEQEVPSGKLHIPNSAERSMGNLIAFIQSTVYYLCLLLDVNWANNPKVVIGKKICNEALKKETSFEQRKQAREKIAQEKFSHLKKS